MPATAQPRLLNGVIEGFYGPLWAQEERLELFAWMASWGLDTYFYCPKDDWKLRAIWRESYSHDEAEDLRALIQACASRGIRFLFALSPGLDIRYSNPSDLECLHRRFNELRTLGCRHFALLFDDIPDRLDPSDLARWGSLAAAQSHVANVVRARLREDLPDGRFLFCPTPYCSRMAAAKLGGEGYLEILGRELAADIDVLWTGPEIISPDITVAHAREVAAILRRPPLIWDNLHANDYDGRRFYTGPYSGRPRELLAEVSGLLINPNCEFQLNFVAFHTLAAFVNGSGPWNPREAHLSALRAWLPYFDSCGTPLSFEDLTFLSDCFYLPYEDGPEAAALLQSARDLLTVSPETWGPKAEVFRMQARRLRDICARMAELRRRPLFWALNRRIWELREEMDLLERYVGLRAAQPDPSAKFSSDFHLPGTYCGGFVARLQRLLQQTPQGDFVPTATPTHNFPTP